ncbi:MAG: PAS domain-containing protein [Lentisphaerae bacterium]|nr:PAS domain-containing protein [Lentisphaerota bacterium]
MDKKNSKFYDRLLERLDRLDPASLQTYLLRLIKEKGFFENVFNNLREGIIVIDNDLKIRFVNRAAGNLLGIDQDAIGASIGTYFKQMVWEELRDTDPESWGTYSRRELEVFYPEHRFLSFYLLPVAERPDPRKSGLPMATLIFHDLTENFQAAEQKVETQKVKAITQLAAGVAHELGNPLNSLSIHLQLLQRTIAKTDDPVKIAEAATEHLAVAQKEVKRLDNIVKNFLNAVRPVPSELLPIDLKRLLGDAIGFMRSEIEDKNIEVEIAFPDSIPTLLGDCDQLTQAFYNLIKNAIQAMPDGGYLHIYCTVDDVYVNLKFVDSGKGISKEDLHQIMEPYFTTKSNGTGLGILIVDRVVRAHGGELTIEGHAGQGAAFTISLPRHARIARQIPAASQTGTIDADQETTS